MNYYDELEPTPLGGEPGVGREVMNELKSLDQPIKTFYRVWWERGGYNHYDLLEEVPADGPPAPKGRKGTKGKPTRVDKIEIVWLAPDLL